MKMRLILASLLFATSLFGQQFTNATVRTVDARRGVGAAIANRDGWFAWSVPAAEGGSICCWTDKRKGCCGGCGLGANRGWSINNFGDHPADGTRQIGTTDVTIALEIEQGLVERVQLFDSSCQVDGRGHEVFVLTNVDAASSIAYLTEKARETRGRGNSVVGAIAQHRHPSALPAMERLAGPGQSSNIREDAIFWIGQRGGERGFRFLRDLLRSGESISLRKKAVFSLSQNDSEGALPALIDLGRNDTTKEIRREAIFWLGQKAGSKAADELRRVVDEDPDDDVREHAVFAISQLPAERSVPMLVALVRNHKSPGVRKKAMFWLAQTGDERAIDMIEEILKK